MKKMNRSLIVLISSIQFICCTTALAQGGWQWMQTNGDGASPDESIKSLYVDQWKNIYVTGHISDLFVRDSAGNIQYDSNFLPILYNYGNRDIWVAKYDFNGNNHWNEYAGSGSGDALFDATVDQNGNTYLIGRLSNNVSRPPHTFNNKPIGTDSTSAFLSKLDSAGNEIYHNLFGYDSLSQFLVSVGGGELLFDQIQNKLHYIFYCGKNQILFNQDTLDVAYYDATFDLNGNYLTSKRLAVADSQLLGSGTFDMDAQGNYYHIGQHNQDSIFLLNDTILKDPQVQLGGLVIAFDSTGAYKWSFKTENSAEVMYNGMVIGDTIIVASDITSLNVDTVRYGQLAYKTGTNTFREGVLIQLDATNGQVIGLQHNDGDFFSRTTDNYSVHANKDFMAIGGKFSNKMTYSGSMYYMESINKTQNTNSDLYFALFDRQGNYICEDLLYTLNSFAGITHMQFIDSSVIVAGFFNDTIFINNDTLIATGKNDVFVGRYDLPCAKKLAVGIKNNYIKAENGVLLYPNPVENTTNLVGKPVNNTAQLITISGKVVQTFQLNQQLVQQQLVLNDHPAGTYFLTIVGKESKQVLKLVKR
ncbi:T9SS type A sorting domain-containing protein [bacterium]|nr:T9SS type A sorting domain-containing protein [bacterium]